LLVEQPRTFLGQRSRCQTVAFLACIHRRQPAPDRRLWDARSSGFADIWAEVNLVGVEPYPTLTTASAKIPANTSG
jgi:hypothetical protein